MSGRTIMPFVNLEIILSCITFWMCVIHAQRTAEMKCQEYRRLTIIRTGIISLISRPVTVYHEAYNCSNTVDVIVGGEVAQEGEFPHQALIGWLNEDQYDGDYYFMCGGSLISDRFVVTAGHCSADNAGGQPVVVRLGEHDLDNDFDHQIDFDIEQFIRHPEYRASSVYHDIALIKLKRTVKFSSFIRPACLWTSRTLNYTTALATGFGQLGFLLEPAQKLNKVSLEIFESHLCDKVFPRSRRMKSGMTEKQICAGSLGGRDTCKGDSGGPIQVMTDDKGCLYHVVGLTSRGQDACGWGNALAIYTRIAPYVNWIEQVVWDVEQWVWD